MERKDAIEKMRQNAIETILDLYPADKNETGRQLLIQAIYECWESLPTVILIRYSQLCIEKENE